MMDEKACDGRSGSLSRGATRPGPELTAPTHITLG